MTPAANHTMRRSSFVHDGLTLSYLDAGGPGAVIVALHATWMEAGTYADLAAALAPKWRVVALDQRGHGHSDHPHSYSWDGFIGDIGALLDHLAIAGPVVLLGNSLGATAAFRFAARHPDRVRALVNEEGPAVIKGNLDFMREWNGVFPTREALADRIGERLAWSVEPSFRQTPEGWTLAFSPTALADAQENLRGDFWSDWCSTNCPALVVRGDDSRAVDGDLMKRMAQERENSRLVTLSGGHVAHHDQPEEFAAAVRDFLSV